jgi:ferredoxin--NADP+ reductase
MPGALTPKEIQELRQKQYNATLVSVKKVQPDLGIFRVKPDYPIPPHKPGQYTTLGLGYWEPRIPGCQEEQLPPGQESKLARRSYSICHPVLNSDGRLFPAGPPEWLEFYVVLVRQTEKPEAPAFTPRLFMLREGDRLHMGERITGHYTLDTVQPGDTVLFFSTGTGEAPHNYMLWDLLRRSHDGPILSAVCVRYNIDLAYKSVHEQVMRQHPEYKFLPLTTREKETVHQKVYIQDLITSGELECRLEKPLDPKTTHAFLCGNPKMIGVPEVNRDTGQRQYPTPTGVIEILEQRGFRSDVQKLKLKGNIHFEEYW